MLFHLGALWRLNEVGLLRGLVRISSVSGGSITAGCSGHSSSKSSQTADHRSYQLGLRKGTYWGIRTETKDYKLATAMNCPSARTLMLANAEPLR
jgi:hypothetical protein